MLLKKLTDAFGMPGHENEIRDLIKEEIQDFVDDMFTDRLGNLIAVKNQKAEGKHLLYMAHMDEAGLVVNHIEESGLIRFVSWGCDARVLPGKVVIIGKKHIRGVIGAKPIHLSTAKERNVALSVDDLYIDIGTTKKEETQKLTEIGDYIGFESEFTPFGEHKVKAKALDDRVGCAMLIEMLKLDTKGKITACFHAQEEVGLRGSLVTAKRLSADFAINVEGTICSDTPESKPHQAVTTQGMGPAISLMDRTAIFDKKYRDAMVATANRHHIPFQYRRTGAGGTDAGNFYNAGTPVIGISLPIRYIHSPVSVMDMRDYENLQKLLTAFTYDYFDGNIEIKGGSLGE